MILNANFTSFLHALNESGTEYLLIGGFAVILYGHNRTTGDMDLWIDTETGNMSRFKEALLSMDYAEDDVDQAVIALQKQMKLSIWLEEDLVELLPVYSSILKFEEAYAECNLIRLSDELQIPVINIDHLIDTKIKAGRDKDLWDASELKKRR